LLHRGEASSSTLAFECLGRATRNAAIYRADAVPRLAKLRASIDGLPRKVALQGPEEKSAFASYSGYTEQRWRDLRRNPADLKLAFFA
jgi:hypothetical protein